MNTSVDLYEDNEGDYHYFPFEPGVPNARREAVALCGRFLGADLRPGAWFRVGDKRGRVHYDRGCSECRAKLVI